MSSVPTYQLSNKCFYLFISLLDLGTRSAQKHTTPKRTKIPTQNARPSVSLIAGHPETQNAGRLVLVFARSSLQFIVCLYICPCSMLGLQKKLWCLVADSDIIRSSPGPLPASPPCLSPQQFAIHSSAVHLFCLHAWTSKEDCDAMWILRSGEAVPGHRRRDPAKVGVGMDELDHTSCQMEKSDVVPGGNLVLEHVLVSNSPPPELNPSRSAIRT